MTLEEMQAAWQAGNRKLVEYKLVNESLIKEVVNQKSQSVLSLIKRRYERAMILVAVYFIIFSSILIGNPFDFKVRYEIPLFFLAACSLFFGSMAILGYKRINKITPDNDTLIQSLDGVIHQYNKFRELLLAALLVAGTSVNSAFLPRIENRRGVMTAILWASGLIAIDIFLIWLFMKAGVIQGRKPDSLKGMVADLKLRLNELRELEEN